MSLITQAAAATKKRPREDGSEEASERERAGAKSAGKVTARGRELLLVKKMAEVEKQGYALAEPLGQGSYGFVVKARDRAGKVRAIKQIEHVCRDRSSALRCLREMSILRRLKHPNIVNLAEAFASGGASDGTIIRRLYLVFEYGGIDLSKLIRSQGAMELQDIRLMIRQLCTGVSFLHRACIIHRDLKPANILIDAGRGLQLKIADFGLARVLARDTARTICGEVLRVNQDDDMHSPSASDGKHDGRTVQRFQAAFEDGSLRSFSDPHTRTNPHRPVPTRTASVPSCLPKPVSFLGRVELNE